MSVMELPSVEVRFSHSCCGVIVFIIIIIITLSASGLPSTLE